MDIYSRVNNNSTDSIRVKAFDLLRAGGKGEKQEAESQGTFVH